MAANPTLIPYVDQMHEVDGWLSPTDARIFCAVDSAQQAASVEGSMLELGVWRGKSAILLAKLLKRAERLFAVDIFDLRSIDHPFFNDPSIFDANLRRFECADKVTQIKMDTEKFGYRLLDELAGTNIRLTHVDGGHDYRVVKNDVDIAMKLTALNGAIAFDDFFNRKHPGVTQAIVEGLLVNRNWSPFIVTGKKLWVCGAASYRRYFEAVRSQIGENARTTTFMGKRCLVVVDTGPPDVNF